MPISIIKQIFLQKKSLFFISRCPVGPQLQMGISPGLCGIFQSSWVHWKEHNIYVYIYIYIHWFQAQYGTLFGPRAMGQAPEPPPRPPPPPPWAPTENRSTSEACLFSVWGSFKLKYFYLGWKYVYIDPPTCPPPPSLKGVPKGL